MVLIPNSKGLDNALRHRDLFDEATLFVSASLRPKRAQHQPHRRADGDGRRRRDGVRRIVSAGLTFCAVVLATSFDARTRATAPRWSACSTSPNSSQRPGATEIGFGDTTGMCNPAYSARVFASAIDRLTGVELTAHFHNTRGQGLANAYAALEAGCRSFESSFGELGGCPVPAARPGTSPPRTSSPCSTRWASTPVPDLWRSSRRPGGAERPRAQTHQSFHPRRTSQLEPPGVSDDGRPLEGLTVLDLGQIYLGPYCGLLMARMGATVIKVEPPAGEPIRFRRDPGLPIVAFDLLNAGKRGLRIDLKQPAGRELFLRMVAQADVVIENFGPGTLDRLGLGYDVLAQTNPAIVMGSGSGYGSYGPYRDFKAMDITVQAMAGVMAATGFDGAPPVKAGVAVADFGGGVHLLAAILAALLQRGRTGRGQHVEVSMHDALIPMLASNIAGFIESEGAVPQRTGNRHGGLGICPYNVYRTADGSLAILGLTNRHRSSLVRIMDQPSTKATTRCARTQAELSR